MRTSGEVLLAFAYLLGAPLVTWPLPITVTLFTGMAVLSESTTTTSLDTWTRIGQLETRALCTTNASQTYQVRPRDNDLSDGPKSSPGPVLIEYLYKSGHFSPHPELCPSQGAQIRVLILVTSAPAHFEIRDSIRQTWGRYARREDVAIAFVLGKPPARLKANLTHEDQVYGDLVIGNSVDQYWSLPLKTISLLEWTNTYCAKASFILKCDDDVFVNVPILLNFVHDPQIMNAKKTIFGNIRQKMLTKRDPRQKHYIPNDEYSRAIMPDFLGGPAYMLTGDSVRPLLDGVCNQSFVRIEDVFITGILAQTVGIKILHASEFNSDKMFIHRPVTDLCKRIATHQVRGKEMMEMWLQIYDDPDGFRQNQAPKPVVCAAPDSYPVPRISRMRYRS